MVIFHSYVGLPEGNLQYLAVTPCFANLPSASAELYTNMLRTPPRLMAPRSWGLIVPSTLDTNLPVVFFKANKPEERQDAVPLSRYGGAYRAAYRGVGEASHDWCLSIVLCLQ